MSGWFYYFLCFIAIPVVSANSVDPDQTLQNAASDLGLHCLHPYLLWDARFKCVNLHGPPHIHFKGTDYTFMGGNCVNLFCLLPEKGSIQKGKNFPSSRVAL